MKRILLLFLENSETSLEVMRSIRQSGFNGTIVETTSLRHALESFPEERHFFSLNDWDMQHGRESSVSLYLVDDERLEALKDAIREHTAHFAKVKGGMFSSPVLDYEGTI